MTGKRVAHYEILEKLGEGGMGAVYKARDTHLDRFVALKVLRPDKVADPERKRRFMQEAKAASALNHPGIVTVHDIDQRDGVDYIVMEYVAGKPLEELIPRKGMRLNEALKVAAQIADALAAAHEAGIVHRDLKPANVMVSEKGQVKVVDFGLAKLTETGPRPDGETVTTPLTGEHTILGTVYYMSPEQAQGLRVEAGSDIFSFGAVLYEMVTGHRAFPGDSKMSALGAIIHKEPEPLPADIPHDLEKLITRCLRKDPERRFHHMDDLKVALEELKEESESGKLAGGAGLVSARPARKRVWLGAGALAVILAASLAWQFFHRPPAPAAPLRAVPLTSYPGKEGYATFSPDGNQVAFSWNGSQEDNWDIYVRLIAEEGARRLTSHPAQDVDPQWSPDGNYVAFLRLLPERAEVMLIPSIGGAERKIGEIQAPGGVVYRRLAWSRDGKGFVVVHRNSRQEPFALFWLPMGGAEKRRLTLPPAGWWGDRDPAVSPDGRTLLFDRASSHNLSELYRLSISAEMAPEGEAQKLTRLNQYSITPAWSGDGREVIFASAAEAYWTPLWRMKVSGPGAPQRLPFAGEGSWQPAVSPSRNRLVYTQGYYDNNIWTAGVSERGHRAGPPRLLIASTRSDREGRYSPDGRRIAFESTRSGTSEIWVCESDGSNPLKLTALGATRVAGPVWSPDGRSIAFSAAIESGEDIFVVSAQGGNTLRITQDPAPDVAPQWSPDGRWIYFRSSRTGDWKVWRAPAAGGVAEVTNRRSGRVSPDGKLVYFTKDQRLWKDAIAGGEETQVFDSIVEGDFAVGADGVYFVGRQTPGAALSIHYYEFATRTTRVVVQPSKPLAAGLDVSPDGRSILYAQQDQNVWDLMLVENFR